MVKIMENVIIKILTVMIIFQIIFMPISHAGFWDEIITDADSFLQDGKTAESADPSVDIQPTMNRIYNLLLSLGVVTSVLVGAGLGIKYMVGSIEEQAKVKETLLPYVIGCVVVFGAFGIWRILIVILSKV